MGEGNIQSGAMVYERGKTGGRVELPLALMPELAREMQARSQLGPRFFTYDDNKAYTVESFGNWFRERIEESGLQKHCSIHGLRKFGATRLADNGATEWQMIAFLGHETPNEARRYVKAANRTKLVADGLRLINQPQELSALSGGLGKNTQ